ncbi:MAG TPA: PEP-CTERM sorting domain-containing protein [Pirellulales bacterium]|nr:PEP-CTERM sorting domain-containing protein [Pirellulales bacterium]
MSIKSIRLAPLALAAAIALLMLAAAPTASLAVAPLAPGVSLDRPGTTPPLFSPYYTPGPVPAQYSTLLISTSFPYLFTGTPSNAFLGSVTSDVWKNPANGQLAFSYKFNNLSPGPTAPVTDIVRVTLDDPTHPWNGVLISDAGSDSSGSSTPQGAALGGPSWSDGAPFVLDRDGVFAGLDAQFRDQNRGTELLSSTNDTSATFWFATSATHFGVTNVGLSDSGDTGSAHAYAPAVPEPASLLLLAIGGGCGAFGAARKRRAK